MKPHEYAVSRQTERWECREQFEQGGASVDDDDKEAGDIAKQSSNCVSLINRAHRLLDEATTTLRLVSDTLLTAVTGRAAQQQCYHCTGQHLRMPRA